MDSDSEGRLERTVRAKKTSLQRTVVAGAGLALTAMLTACSSGGSGAEAPDGNETQPSVTPQASSGLMTASPKDATATDVCSLLSSKAATALGVKPDGKKKSSLTDPQAPGICEWESPGRGYKSVSFTAFDGRSIQQYYNNQTTYVDFARLKVAGYPAVQANKNDPMVGGSCSMFFATKQNQVVMAFTSLPNEQIGKVDPCGMAKKAFELSVPSWPAAQ